MTNPPELNGPLSARWSDPFKTPSVWVPPFILVAILVLSPTGMTASRCPACHQRRRLCGWRRQRLPGYSGAPTD
jgi:hypothetical protein